MTPPVPSFDEAAHRYTHEDRPYWSVTQILDGLSLNPPYPADSPEQRDKKAKGTAVHKAADLAVWGRLDWQRTHQEIIPYMDGLMEKVEEYKIRPIYTEVRGVHLVEGFAGTIDLFCSVFDSELAIFDYKSGSIARCVELQTAGYGELALYMESFKAQPLFTRAKMPRRFSMQLTPGRAIVRECVDPFDYAAFIGAVRLFKWQNERRQTERTIGQTT